MPTQTDIARPTAPALRDSVTEAAGYGAAAWMIYAIVECTVVALFPWLTLSSYTYVPVHAGLTLILFLLYPLIGALLGAGAGALMHVTTLGRVGAAAESSRALALQAAAGLPLVLAFALNIASGSGPMIKQRIATLAIALFFAGVLAAGALLPSRVTRLRALANPWLVSALLLIVPWTMQRLGHAWHLGIVIAGVVMATVGTIAWWVDRADSGVRRGNASARPVILRLAVVALVILVCSAMAHQTVETRALAATSTPGSAAPNVILITMDTVRADHLSLYGYARDTTPQLRQLAEQATCYTRAIASSDMTLSSHASLFTGLYASTHSAHYDLPAHPTGRPLPERFDTLAELLAAQGYRTVGVVANHGYIGHSYGLNQGFQCYDERVPVPWLGAARPYMLRQAVRNLAAPFVSASASEQIYRYAPDITASATALLARCAADPRPFLLFVNYMDAHAPYDPPPPYDALFPGRDTSFRRRGYDALQRDVSRLSRRVTERELNHLVSQYDGGIAHIDFQIGVLLANLKASGVYDRSFIIVTSDHGESFGQRDLVGHGVSVYQDLVHVPLLMKFPDQQHARVVDDPVSLVDILPTVLEVVGQTVPPDVAGRSLVGAQRAPRNIFSESFPNGHLVAWHSRFNRVERAIVSGPTKLIESTTGTREAYDLSDDPDEQRDLYGTGQNYAQLQARLDQWVGAVASASAGQPANTSVQPDGATIERLKALGYL